MQLTATSKITDVLNKGLVLTVTPASSSTVLVEMRKGNSAWSRQVVSTATEFGPFDADIEYVCNLLSGSMAEVSESEYAFSLTEKQVVSNFNPLTEVIEIIDPETGLPLVGGSITSAGLRSALAAGGLATGNDVKPKFVLNDTDILEAGDSSQSLLLTASLSTRASKIGHPSVPYGIPGTISSHSAPVDASRSVPWVADVEYVPGSAPVASIIGGSDHIVNQIAGTVVGGAHHYLPYNAGGHSTIVGGSNSRNAGQYSFIGGGTQNTVNGGTNAKCAAVVGGELGLVASDFSGLLAGYHCEIQSGAQYAAIVGGRDCTISGAGTYAAICGGNSDVVEGQAAGILAGYDNEILGASTGSVILGGSASVVSSAASRAAVLAGQYNVVQANHNYTVVFGRDAKSEGPGGWTCGRTKLVNVGDCQASMLVWGQRTTAAGLDTMVLNDNTQWTVGTPGMACTISALIIGVNEANNAMCAYQYVGCVKWASGAGQVADAGGSGATRQFTQIYDEIGVSELPVISVSAGTIRPRVAGKAATNIKWTCKMDIAAVRA